MNNENNEVKPLTILEARDFFLKCGCDRRTMIDEREMNRRYCATPGVTFDLEQLWKCEYLDEVIEEWEFLDNNKKGLRYYEFFIYMNRNYACFGKYVSFLLDQLVAAKELDERTAYSYIGRYTSSANWANGYSLLCYYGDYADLIYSRINELLRYLPASERKEKTKEANKAAYEYVKSEEYIRDREKYSAKRIV